MEQGLCFSSKVHLCSGRLICLLLHTILASCLLLPPACLPHLPATTTLDTRHLHAVVARAEPVQPTSTPAYELDDQGYQLRRSQVEALGGWGLCFDPGALG